MRNMNIYENAKYYWGIYGSFGMVKGDVAHDGGKITHETEEYLVCSERTEHENGLVYQTGFIKNTCDHPITVTTANTKFVFEGGEHAVYTQCNHWQNESKGAWQPLVTTISGRSYGVRDSFAASPFFVLWDKQCDRGIAFHVIPNCIWQYSVSNLPYHDSTEALKVEVDIGIYNRDFSMELQPGEILHLPDIIYYEVRNRVDLDAWKLHRYLNKVYPRVEHPVIYNNWLCHFGNFSFEKMAQQVDRAAELGCEYFVVDSGWYGNNPCWPHRAEWWEKKPGDGAFDGRMKEFAALVRSKGMKFGFWLEVESAGVDSEALKKYPEQYFEYDGLVMLDFANPAARDRVISEMKAVVELYGAEFIKYDFNNDTRIDYARKSLVPYYEGFREFRRRVLEEIPGVYHSNCAAGGARMSIPNHRDFGSAWFTDNQSVYESLKIVKDTVLRLPSQSMERWVVATSANVNHSYGGADPRVLISTNDGTWNNVRGVSENFLKGFMLPGPIGFSCDLNAFTDTHFEMLKQTVAEFKENRDFWKKAECRILCDTDSLTVFQYNDEHFERVEIFTFCWKIHQRTVRVYPVVDESACYDTAGQTVCGKALQADGLAVATPANYEMTRVILTKK